MKINLIVFAILTIFLSSCSKMRKTQKNAEPLVAIQQNPELSVNNDDPPIHEAKEKIVRSDNLPMDQHRYYVIIGSFKSQENARKYQEQIAVDGFVSVLLRNEEGLYRVSVKSSNDIMDARNEIRRIRSQFEKYDDTWLLISIR